MGQVANTDERYHLSRNSCSRWLYELQGEAVVEKTKLTKTADCFIDELKN